MTLADLLYPDYGIAAAMNSMTGRGQSIGILGQRLCAYLAGSLARKGVFSVVLHGPPGTMKTTFFEALAKAAEVPFVEITPSDILQGGLEQMEQRSKKVFGMLSMLTNVVILFDEFDSILKKRTDDVRPEARNVFEFLTPGMLPKLRRLHECAEAQRIVYGLSTNLVSTLDEAAIRVGRFDERLGIYPPDALSRLGHLAVKLVENDTGHNLSHFDACLTARCVKAVAATGQGAIATVAPMLGEKSNPHFKWVKDGGDKQPGALQGVSPEKRFDEHPDRPVVTLGDKGHALTPANREWLEWGWCWVSDKKFEKATLGSGSLEAINEQIQTAKTGSIAGIQCMIEKALTENGHGSQLEGHPRESCVMHLRLIQNGEKCRINEEPDTVDWLHLHEHWNVFEVKPEMDQPKSYPIPAVKGVWREGNVWRLKLRAEALQRVRGTSDN
jgi:hypothetical protein